MYVVNLMAIAGVVLLVLRLVASRLGTLDPRRRKFIVVPAAALLLVTSIAFEALVLSMGVWRPISSFSGDPNYSELRPVAVHVLKHPRNCTASPFWFPDQRARSNNKGKL
jgi:hypothetical protein